MKNQPMILRLCSYTLLLGLLFTTSSFNHPIKLTSSLVEYNLEKRHMIVQCRVFIDDFIKTIKKEDFNATNLSEEDIAEVECYFYQSYRIAINDVQHALNYQSSKAHLKYNVLDLKFSVEDLTLKEGDKMTIQNILFFSEFGFKQANKMIIRIPPFIDEDHYETTFQKYSIYYEF